MKLYFYVGSFYAVLAASSALATEVSECYEITSDEKRLECFDRTKALPTSEEPPAISTEAEALLKAILADNDVTLLIEHLIGLDDALSVNEDLASEAESLLLAHTKPLPSSNAEANMRGYQALSKVRPETASYSQKATSYSDAFDRQRYAILGKLKKDFVEFDSRTWYKHPSKPRFEDTRNYLQIYLGEKGNQSLTRLKLNYTGDSWLFVESASASIDGKHVRLPLTIWKRDNDSEIWEWSDVVLSAELREISLQIANSKETIIRFNGSQYYDDWKVPSKDKKAILDMLLAEEALKEKLKNG